MIGLKLLQTYGRLPARLSTNLKKRTVSRLGYVAVLGLLVFSSMEAYRIHGALSVRHDGIFRQYLKQDEALRQLRNSVFLASTCVRDFFLSTKPDRAATFEADMRRVRADWQNAMSRVDFSREPVERTSVVRADLDEFWGIVEPVSSTMMDATDPQEYDFIQREVAPRRTQLYTELLEMTETEQQLLRDSERDFAFTQRSALRRLLRTLALCVALGILLSWFTLRHTERLEAETARQFEEVARAKGEFETLSARLVQVEEEGRRSVSRELHDEIGQNLTAVRIEIAQALKHADGLPMKESLLRARALTEQSVQTVRDLCLLLRPALLDELGLIPALEWQVQDFSRRSGIACDFAESGVRPHLPDPVNTCVYRVVQEALHNCEKHASARRIRIAVRQQGGVLTVEVCDDGRGFALDPKSMPLVGRGLGILGMRERAVMVGGEFRLDSSPGSGTRLSLNIPVPMEAAPPPSASLEQVRA